MIPISAPIISESAIQSVIEILKKGELTSGKYVSEFEIQFSKYVNSRNCVAVNSGTSALHLMLLAHNIGPGDEVIVPSFSFAATANAVALTGATPIFCDIDLVSFCISPQSILENISSKTRAVMPVHLYGHPADMDSIKKICEKFQLLLFEDCAQAHLAQYNKQYVGTFGESSAFSFYSTKNMTTGEGGIIVSENLEIIRKMKLLRNQGQIVKYQNEIVGYNNRMSDINAVIGLDQINKIENWTRLRQRNANFFNENLKNVIKPIKKSNIEHVYHQYTIRVPDLNRDKFASRLRDLGVGTGIYYPTPIHKLKSFNLNLELINTNIAANEVISIPVHQNLTEMDLEHIVESVNSAAF